MFWTLLSRSAVRTFALTSAVALASFTASATSLVGGHTSVDLDPTTVSALTSLGFSIAPIAPGTLNGLTASFPITAATSTMIDHSGGLDFTNMGTTAGIKDFIIDLTTGVLSGSLAAGGTTTPGVNFFNLAPGGSSYILTLDSQLAGILSSAYGIPNLTGVPIGTATVTPAPEPASTGLIAAGLLLGAAYLRRRLAAGLCLTAATDLNRTETGRCGAPRCGLQQ
jgi:hypothetical protein